MDSRGETDHCQSRPYRLSARQAIDGPSVHLEITHRRGRGSPGIRDADAEATPFGLTSRALPQRLRGRDPVPGKGGHAMPGDALGPAHWRAVYDVANGWRKSRATGKMH